jgi:Group II intron, maturase-specific domain
MRGWRSYFGFCETPDVLISLTRWVRLRLRAALWRQWKTYRRRRAVLIALGVRPRVASNTAASGRGPWYLARAKARSVGYRMLTSGRSDFRPWSRAASLTNRTSVYGSVRTVVWEVVSRRRASVMLYER